MADKTEKCIFCGSKDVTNEHIFSHWTHKLLPPREKGRVIAQVGTNYLGQQKTRLVKLPGQLQDWQIQCVCGGHRSTCNNGWMKRLEDAAKPILTPLIEGRRTRLLPEHQAIIAAWVSLKIMVSEHWRHGSITVHWTQRRSMMRRQIPPMAGWGIWIGHYERVNWKGGFISRPFFYPEASTPARIPPYYNGASTTMVIGKLFIQVIHGPVKFLVEWWRFPLRQSGPLYRIWPPQSASIKWPCGTLTDLDAENIANAAEVFFRRCAIDTAARAGAP
ncbi:MAG: hypothetical protein WCC64_00995 [Aliidongia sp.]